MLIKPIVTEKSMAETVKNRFTFEVDRLSRKPEIEAEIERLFGVKVVAIRTLLTPGKKYRMGKRWVFKSRPDKKKAIVTLAKDQRIDLFDVSSK